MQKDFDTWNEEKKIIHTKKQTDDFFVNPREIWFVKMGMNIGFEENGKSEFVRPVLVIKKVGMLFFTIALTTKGKEDNKFYHKFLHAVFTEKHFHNSGRSFAILSQARVFDKKRFQERIGILPSDEFEIVKQKITRILL